MDTGIFIWRKSGRRTVHFGRLYDDQKYPADDEHATGKPSKKMGWKVIWKNLMKQKRKLVDSKSRAQQKAVAPYSSETYMQNFDDGQSGQTVDEYLNDFLPRSFTARYADPSKLLS